MAIRIPDEYILQAFILFDDIMEGIFHDNAPLIHDGEAVAGLLPL